jgi:hypothetical protein
VETISKYRPDDDDERKLQELIEELGILNTRKRVALESQTYEELETLKSLIQETEDQIREVRERLRLRRVGQIFDRNIDNQIGSLGGGSIANVPALPAPVAPAAAKSAAATSEGVPNDSTVNGRR